MPGVAARCLWHDGSPGHVWAWGLAVRCCAQALDLSPTWSSLHLGAQSRPWRSAGQKQAVRLPASGGAPLLPGALSFVTTLTLCFDPWVLYASFLYHCFSDGAVNFFESGSLGFLGFPIP